MARPRNRALDYVAYLAVRLLVGFAQILSVEQSYALADGLAALLYRVDKRHRKVALENLELAYGDSMSPEDRDRTVREVYRHFCRMLMEILHIPRKLHLETWRDRIELKSYR